jgi:putative Mg2+ transporter-C (MgtC) family protein
MTWSSLDGTLVVRIIVGTVLGAVIGYERDIHGRPAGLRTHALVALASATFMVVSTHMVQFQNYAGLDHIDVDGSRIAASVVSGIGFLAGGAILRTGISVQGLTTAAGLWLVAAIGLCAGGGMFVESVAATVIGIAALTLLRRFEDKDDRSVWRRLSVTLTEDARANPELLAHLETAGVEARLEGWERDVGVRRLVLAVRLPRAGGEDHLVAALEAERGVTRMQLEPLARS